MDGWRLKEQEDQEGFAVNEKQAKKEEKDHGEGMEKYINMARDYVEESYDDMNKKFKKVLHEASRLGAKIPPTPRLPTIDCEETVSRCLFVKIHRAEDLLAMDSDGGAHDSLFTPPHIYARLKPYITGVTGEKARACMTPVLTSSS